MKFWFLVKNFLKRRIVSKTFLFINIFLFVIICLAVIIPAKALKSTNNSFELKVDCYFYSPLSFNDTEQETIISRVSYLKQTYKNLNFYFTNDENFNCDIFVVIKAPTKNDRWEITIKADKHKDVVRDLSIALEHTHLRNPVSNSITVKLNDEQTLRERKKAIIKFFIIAFVVISSGISVLCSQVAGSDIISEKSSRVIEQILMNVTPHTHFYSKVIAGLIFGICQTVLIIIYGVFAVLISKHSGLNNVSELFDLFKLALPVGFATISVLLIAFFTITMSVIIGAIGTSEEEYGQIMAPLNIIFSLSLYGALGISSSLNNYLVLSQVFSYLPISGLAVAPISFLKEAITWHETLVALLLQISYIYNFLELIFPKYHQYILNYNRKQSIWKKLFSKLKGKRESK